MSSFWPFLPFLRRGKPAPERGAASWEDDPNLVTVRLRCLEENSERLRKARRDVLTQLMTGCTAEEALRIAETTRVRERAARTRIREILGLPPCRNSEEPTEPDQEPTP